MSNRLIQEVKQKRRDRRRVVAFNPKIRVLEIPTVVEMSDREIASVWQTPEDSKNNQADLIQCIRAVRKNPRDASVCTRGIEKLIDPTSVLRLRRCREGLVDSVLDNQEVQWERGLYDADAEEIRSVATKFSQQSVEEAITLAAKDEAYVRTMRRREMSLSSPSSSTSTSCTTRSSRSAATNKTKRTIEQNGTTMKKTTVHRQAIQ